MMDSYMYIRALEFAYDKHKGQKREDGESYITHPMEVSMKYLPKSARWKDRIVALLHDVLEDTDTSIGEMYNTFGAEITNAVIVLTKPDKELKVPYKSYINHIKNSTDEIAIKVKIADLKHNLSTIDNIKDEKKRNRLKSRYEKALETLK